MDFLALQTRVAEETGLDLNNANDLASIQSWVNQAYQHVSGLFSWDWLFAQGTIQTVADITTGTATVTANSTTVTLSTFPTVDGSSVSVANQWMINFPSVGKDWYFISTHVTGSVTLTMSVPFVSSTNLTAGSYILRKVLYSLPSDLDKIIDIRQQTTSVKLVNIDPRTFDAMMPNPIATGNPIYYSFVGRDTASPSNWQISLFPTPTTKLNLQLKYYKTVTELVSNADQPLMPSAWTDVLVYGALGLFGYPFIDDDRESSALLRFNAKLKEMKASNSHAPDNLTVIQPWDSRVGSSLRRPRLPDTYPNTYGL